MMQVTGRQINVTAAGNQQMLILYYVQQAEFYLAAGAQYKPILYSQLQWFVQHEIADFRERLFTTSLSSLR